MSAILAVCGDTFCAMVSDGRYVEEPITGEKPHILKNDLPKVRKINRNVVVGFAGDTLAAVQIINAGDRVPDPVPDAGEGRQDPAREGRHGLGAAGGRAAHRGWAQPQGRVHHDDDGQR